MAVVVSPQVAAAAKKVLVDALRDVFIRGRVGIAEASGTPEFLAGPEPGNPLLGWQHRSGRAACDRWARGAREGFLPGDDLVMRSSCELYLGSESPGDPTTAPPFTGGQCPGVSYSITATYVEYFSDCSTANRTFGPNTVLGPVGGLRPVPGSVNCSLQGATARGWEISTGSGFTGLTDVAASGRSTPTNIVVTRVDGLPDNCGDPPTEFDSGPRTTSPDPNPGPVGGPTGYPFPNLDIDISPTGDIVIDFGDGEPPEVISPDERDGDGDGDGGDGGGSDPNVAPTTPGDAGGTGATGDGGSEDGEAPEGSELTGVLVRVISAHENANKVDRSPVDVFRGVGYVAMGYPGLLGVDTSAAVVESPQFFHAQQRGLTAWRVRANVGFNLETTPYYREIEQ